MNMGRYEDASSCFHEVLSHEPEHLLAQYCLGICKLNLKRVEEAGQLADSVIGQDPEFYGGFELKSDYFLELKKYNKALEYINTALSYNTENSDLWGKKSYVQYLLKNFDDALKSAESGLYYNAEHTYCLNMKTRVHAVKGDKSVVYENILKTLEVNPQNAYSHANAGWALLERRDYKNAKKHFFEALKINPNIAIAQSGMKEAVKATNPLYKLLLIYGFWMAKWGTKMQWVIIIAIYLFYRFIGFLSTHYPFLTPLFYLLIALLLLSWILSPISNLVLLSDRYARYLLEKNETISAILTGSLVTLSIIAFICALLFTGEYSQYGQAFGIYFLLLAIPTGTMLIPSSDISRRKLVKITIGIALVGLVGLLSFLITGKAGLWGTLFFLGVFAYQWIFNAEMVKSTNSRD